MRTKWEIRRKYQEFLKLKEDYDQPGADLNDDYEKTIGYIKGAIETMKWIQQKPYS